VIDDNGDVAVAFAIGELVDPDKVQALEPRGVQACADDPLHDLAHGHPGDTHHHGDGGLIGDPGQVRRGLFERRAEPAASRPPGDLFVYHPAPSALDAARSVTQPDPRGAESKMPPPARFTLIVAWRPLSAAAAARLLAPRPNVEDDSFGAHLGRLHHDARDSQKRFEYLDDAHGALPARLMDLATHRRARVPCVSLYASSPCASWLRDLC